MIGSPKVTNIFCERHFRSPSPHDIKHNAREVIFEWGGVKIVKIMDDLVVKYGPGVTEYEAKVLQYVKEQTSVPVPRVFSVFTYGPIADDSDKGSSMHTYIIMDEVHGTPLDKAWHKFNQKTKSTLCHKLAGYVHQLRSLHSPAYVGSLQHGPVADNILENEPDKGPFPSVPHFHNTIAEVFARRHKGKIGPYVRGMLNTSHYAVKFTHADLRQANILVRDDGIISGIIDWEMAGWYPEYWEFAKIFSVYRFHDDWGNHIIANFHTYFAESAAYTYVSGLLW